MPPTMMTQSVGWPAAASQGGGKGGRAGSSDGRTRGRSANQGDNRIDGQGGQVGGQGSEVTKVEVKEMIGIKTEMPSMTTSWVMLGMPLKALTIEKMESVHDMSGCKDSQRVKYNAGSFVGKAITWWNSEIRTRGRETAVGMSWEDFQTFIKEDFCPSNEMQNLDTELWNHVMVRAGHAVYIDRFHDLARLVPHLLTPKSKRIGSLYKSGGEETRMKTEGTFPIKGMRSIISMVSISLEGFLPSILLMVVIIVAVVIVAIILVVVVIGTIVGVVIVVASIGVVIVVMIIRIVVIVDGGVSYIIKLLFVIIVTFPSMLWGSPSMKASIIFLVFSTMFVHKTANS
nr:reverse transcriptase domain-containing protein [Tanacetum cinerariifolium]